MSKSCTCWYCHPDRERVTVDRKEGEGNMEFRWRLARMGKIVQVTDRAGVVILKSSLRPVTQ